MNEQIRERLSIALALTEQSWTNLSLGDDPRNAASSDLDVTVERVTCLLLVRLVAAVSPLGTFRDLSTTNVCVSCLRKPRLWPAKSLLPESAILQLEDYTRKILEGYKNVPYHNFQHAFHVILSTNKLLDMMLSSRRTTYGLKNDPLSLMACMFAALLHDVEHQGIPNRQLAAEDDRLAVLYNDQSIAEQWSLYVAFSEFLQADYKDLRKCLFAIDASNLNDEDKVTSDDNYRNFRRTVINLVLMTDIASPERTQIGKSKWKEAFGEPFETVDAKVRRQVRRMSLTGRNIEVNMHTVNSPSALMGLNRRGSSANKRGSIVSALGDEPGDDSNGNNNNDDDSLSVTPENSFHEDEGNIVETKEYSAIHRSSSLPQTFERRMSSMGMDRRNTGQTSSSGPHQGSGNANNNTSRYRQRLGILRTVDLSGETLETFSTHYRRGSMFSSNVSEDGTRSTVDLESDEPNHLKASVVLEVILTAADVAHNLQGWDQMVTWSTRLYLELRKAHISNRGMDPSHKWFENQIGFLESYLLPLARRLEDTNVFRIPFAPIVEGNRDTWLTHGFDVAQATISEGLERYPAKKK